MPDATKRPVSKWRETEWLHHLQQQAQHLTACPPPRRRPRTQLPPRVPRPPPPLPVATPQPHPRPTLVQPKSPRPCLRRPPLRPTPPLPRAGNAARRVRLHRHRCPGAGGHRRRAVPCEPAAVPAHRRRVALGGLLVGRGSAAVRGQRQHLAGVSARFAGEIRGFFRIRPIETGF